MRETLASTSSSTSPATASGGVPPAESAWITTRERISPRWQSFALPPQAMEIGVPE
ncbi:hypothetical protein Hanom_Chr07g00583341 [Helianthus anomalus]